MSSNDSRGPRRGRGGRRPSSRDRRQNREQDRTKSRRDNRDTRSTKSQPAEPAKKLSFWGKILAFFTGGIKKTSSSTRSPRRDALAGEKRKPRATEDRETRHQRRAIPPERIEVTTPKLYVGNLSYEATESDLQELFNGVGKVQNAEIVTQKGNYRSKGFGFVTMLTVDEAKRAVQELHDKAFMGRKLVVSGSKSEGPKDHS